MNPLDLLCNAPPGPIVRAVHLIGCTNAPDRRWLKESGPHNDYCSCGALKPQLEEWVFTFSTGEEATYLLGQCQGCETIFWRECL